MPKVAFPRIVDSTILKDFSACWQKANLSHFHHYRSKHPSVHLHFGGVLARGLEVVRKSFYGKHLSIQASLCAGIEAIIRAWGDVNFPSEIEKTKTLPGCIEALLSYFEEYPLGQDFISPLLIPTTEQERASGYWKGYDKKPAVEFSFCWPLPNVKHPETGEPILYGGRFDMLGIFNNTIYVCDEKTTTRLGEAWAKQWELRSQMTGYCWGAQKFGYPAAGCIVRGIGILVDGAKHLPVIEQRAHWEVERWVRNTELKLEMMILAWREDKWILSLDEACDAYGGCAFKSICTHEDAQPYLAADFTVDHWDPLERKHDD